MKRKEYTPTQMDLLNELFRDRSNGRAERTFDFSRGCYDKRWDSRDVVVLEGDGLVVIPGNPDDSYLTEEGIDYIFRQD